MPPGVGNSFVEINKKEERYKNKKKKQSWLKTKQDTTNNEKQLLYNRT